MTSQLGRLAAASALTAVFSFGSANAAPITVTDTYWGGSDAYQSDVIGAVSQFDTTSLTVDRIGQDLVVSVTTNYANHVGTLDTRLGALFIGDPTKLNYNNVGTGINADPTYDADTFTADTDRYGYAFDFDIANPNSLSVTSGAGSLYKLNGTGSDVLLSAAAGGFRHNQAVDVNSSLAMDTGVNGTWSITTNSSGPGSINFNIGNFFNTPGLAAIYQTSLTLAWAMTCANDVILAQVIVPRGSTPDVPLPAGLLLLGSGLAGLGAISRRRKAKV